jgi:Phosphatidylserine/phosphatidylglycerophosphate/cardiolipin synthases and related enzymes
MAKFARWRSRISRKTLVVAVVLAIVVTLVLALVVVNAASGEKKIQQRIEHLYGVADPEFLHVMGVLLGPPVVSGNRAQVLVNGDRIFPSMLEAIRGARRTIDFETYIYWSGTIGKEFADALAERARAGVQVHVLLDWVRLAEDGAGADRRAEVGRRRGPEVPPAALVASRPLNNRTHRKLLIVDGGSASPAASASPRHGPATPRTPTIGATPTSASKGRWSRRCRACSWTTGSRPRARCCTAPSTSRPLSRSAAARRRSSAARRAAAARAWS